MRLALLGLGKMGVALARLWLQSGHEVTVWNRTAAAAKAPRAARQPALQRFDGGMARLDRCKNHPVAPSPVWKAPYR